MSDDLTEPVTIGAEAYVSADYARAEQDRLWRKVWLQAGRLEDIPEVGNFVTYDILDDSIIIVRTATDALRAYHNVCTHRGRRLVDPEPGAHHACGRKNGFTCPFHGWRFDLDGRCTQIRDREDWGGALDAANTALASVKVDAWGGWIWINMDPACGPLRDYLEPAASMLDPFQLENMRPRWRRWVVFDCNWKVAAEAFNEIYHVDITHPELTRFGEYRGWAKAQGLHSNIGYDAPKNMDPNQAAKLRVGSGDARVTTAEMQNHIWEEVNTNTTATLVEAARRLVDELPEGTPPDKVLKHWLDSARRDDAARGVVWPAVDPAHVGKSGTAWQIFPNFQIGHSVNNALVYNFKPYRADPGKCVFEIAVYELFPKGEAPKTEWIYTPVGDPSWRSVLPQDFSNMAAVQAGMKSLGFRGTKPNPYRERTIANLHKNLAAYMGTGAPRPLK
ncbi:MAG: aromatic ring-hydroxylating dioxygenase subunit alpha [Parvularculaceae bacterium]|nr:aromatic ring-hydroxylating dioxygenase subunit alpha [Parvularculaceae bacterium]